MDSRAVAGSATCCATIVDLLRRRAAEQPGQLAYRFLRDGGRDEVSLTYAELDRTARAIAARLVESGATGERAILLYPPGLDYLTAFFGCLYAGTIAVPAYPPNPARLQSSLGRLAAIVRDAQPRVTMTTSAHVTAIEALTPAGAAPLAAPMATDEIPGELASAWTPPSLESDSVAFLQYTSGSTASPRGVVLSHGNLMHNSGLIHTFFGHSERTRGVAWLPPYHDMGLIGGILQPLYGGFPITLLSHADFLARPLCWLEAVSRFRATTSGGPNFAYDLCVRKTRPEERTQLDLSEWRVAFNGAESIRAETLDRFAAAFEPAGFRREAFHPCYGLAEATLIVTGGAPAAPATERFVSCGRSADDQRVEIVDPATATSCPPGAEGEIWVAGPSVARSYWGRPEQSLERLRAHLADSGDGPFLRTGDLGYLRDGELFVTGRLKDLIIIRGRNHYPQDIEASAEHSHPALRPGCGAAFAVPEGEQERLVVAWEVSPKAGPVDGAEVARAIRAAVARDHDVQVRTALLLPPGGVPKTSSGKVQRSLCSARYVAGDLGGEVYDVAGIERAPEAGLDHARLRAAPPAQRRVLLLDYLRRQVAAAAGVALEEVDPERSLLSLGVDSLAIITVGQAVHEDLGVTAPPSLLADAPSLAALAEQLSAGAGPDDEAGPDAVPAENALSHAQRTLWFLHQLAPDSAEHNVTLALRLKGALDVTALRTALDGLVARHAALRTTFTSHDGEPVANVHATGTACVRVHDECGEAQLAGPLDAATDEPFDLATGPLLRVDLFPTAPDETVMLVVAHHIITDFWSMTTLVQELETLYAGRPAELPPPAASYADVVAWQEQTLTGPDGPAHRAFWEDALHGAVEELQLLRRETATPGGSAASSTRRLRLDPALTQRLTARARAEGVTVYMVYLAAYQVLLHRYTGQDDLLVGTPMAGRGRPEFERVVGYCMNPVAIRSRLTGDESFRDTLAQVRRQVLGALDHQTFPLHLLAGGRRAGAPLFRTLFVYNGPPVRGSADLALLAFGTAGLRRPFADLIAEPVEVRPRATAVDLHLTLAEIDQSLFATFRYRDDVLDDAAAERMMRHFELLLLAFADDADQPVRAAAMLDDDERQHILTGWSAGPSAHPTGVTVPDLIERQAATTPDAIAVTGEAGRLTYRELAARAERLAQRLVQRGVGAGARIGLFLDRSTDMIVAMLAALKSGGAYVPADPAHPRERVAEMFRDAGVTCVLTQRQLAGELPPGSDAIALDDPGTWTGPSDASPRPAIADDSPVYVMYTSGSTGRPKGVVINHRSLANYVRFAAEHFAMAPGDRVLQFASLSFDASAQQIYAALTSGATLVLRNDRMLSTPAAFLDQCAEWAITVLDLPTAYWHELVVGITDAGATVPDTLRLVIVGGERAVPELVRDWRQRVGSRVRLINNYGPTEATIVAITRELTTYTGTGEVPIGRPVAGSTAYVLDALRQPVPAGVVGELYLGGTGLALGYLDRPALTAQAFVPDPFAGRGRLYRTGDLASLTAEGEFVFRGRADRQVKLRGYRVEPGEIESALRDLPAVADALVVLRENPCRLIGYLVGTGANEPAPGELRMALRRALPEYMVPSAFVTVPTFPLNHNGKVDLAALPAPRLDDPDGLDGPDGPTEPRTPIEAFLVETFASVLGLESVGADDDFFGRGGHSLLATKVIARVRDRYQVDLPLRAVFDAPTPAGLAAHVERSHAGGTATAGAPPLEPVPRDQPLPLSFAQEGIWFLQMLTPGSAVYNVPRALRIRGDFDAEAVADTFAALEERHEILRTTFPNVDGEPVQVVHPPRGIPLAFADLQDVAEADRDERLRQMILDAGRTPFDLEDGQPIRVTLARLGPRHHVLIVIEHHLVHDGWAQGVFLRDFVELYDAIVHGREARLPQLRVQFADYAYWQRKAISGPTLQRLTEFWKREVAGAPQQLSLPTDRPYPRKLTFAGDQEVLIIDGELGRTLRRFSREHTATLFMTMFSAFATMLHRYSGQDDILVGVGVANRQRPEAENLLGMMINTVLLRAEMSGDPAFAELLERVKQRCLGVYAHQDMPFEKLVQALRPKRSVAHMPLCQVLFTFLDTPMPHLRIPGVHLEPVVVHNRTAKFDLNVVVQPHAEQHAAGGGDAGPDDRITVLWEYNADVFDATTIHRMLEHFQAVLRDAMATPDRTLVGFLADLEAPRPVALAGASTCD